MQDKEMQQRIALASPAQLVVITYELLLRHLSDAARDFDTVLFAMRLEKARACVNELSAALNLELPVSAELLQLYVYVNKLLIRAQMENSAKPVAEACRIIEHLLTGWRELAASSDTAANDKTMYAGLTYTKTGALSEYEPDGSARDYLA